MTASREQKSSPLLECINQMGPDCDLSKIEVHKRLTTIYTEIVEIKDSRSLIKSAVKNRNLFALQWFFTNALHPVYKYTNEDLSTALEEAVAYSDGNHEKIDFQTSKRREIISWLANPSVLDVVSGVFETATEYQNYFYFNIYSRIYPGNNFYWPLSKLQNNKNFLKILHWFLHSRKLQDHEKRQFDRAIEYALQKDEFTFTAKLVDLAFPMSYQSIVIALKQYRNSKIDAALLFKLLNHAKHGVSLNWILSATLEVYKDGFNNADVMNYVITELAKSNVSVTVNDFLVALELNDLSLIKQLTAFLKANDVIDASCLLKAIEIGNISILEYILKQFNAKKLVISESYLFKAIKAGHVQIVKIIMDELNSRKILINKTSRFNTSCPALELAIKCENLPVITLLLANKAHCTKATLKLITKNGNKTQESIAKFLQIFLYIKENKYEKAAIIYINMNNDTKYELIRLFANTERDSLIRKLAGEHYLKALSSSSEFQSEMKPIPNPSAPAIMLHTESSVTITSSLNVVPGKAEMLMPSQSQEITPSVPIFHFESSDEAVVSKSAINHTSITPVCAPAELSFKNHPTINAMILEYLSESPKPNSSSKPEIVQPKAHEHQEEKQLEGVRSESKSVQNEGCGEAEQPGALTSGETVMLNTRCSLFQPARNMDHENDLRTLHKLLDISKRGANFWEGYEELQKRVQEFCYRKEQELFVIASAAKQSVMPAKAGIQS